MSEPAVCLADRKRYHVRHACGFPLVAYPYRVGTSIRAGFAAGLAHVHPGVERGQVIGRCPQCGGDLRLAWSDFESRLGETFNP